MLAPMMKSPSTWFRASHTAPAPVSVIQILRSAQAEPEAFEKGVRAYLQTSGMDPAQVDVRTPPAILDFVEWQNLVSPVEGVVFVGMVSEADFILVNECIREKGLRLLCRGTHVVGDAAHSRHAFTTTASSAGIGAAFDQSLKQPYQHAYVQEVAMHKAAFPFPAACRIETPDGNWSELLGHALGQVALGHWEPSAISNHIHIGDAFTSVNVGYASFVIGVQRRAPA